MEAHINLVIQEGTCHPAIWFSNPLLVNNSWGDSAGVGASVGVADSADVAVVVGVRVEVAVVVAVEVLVGMAGVVGVEVTVAVDVGGSSRRRREGISGPQGQIVEVGGPIQTGALDLHPHPDSALRHHVRSRERHPSVSRPIEGCDDYRSG